MKRIFIAINLPEEIKSELENLEKEIAELFPKNENGGLIKWVKPENLHITLLFIGAIKDEKIPQICQTAKEISQTQKPFFLTLKKVHYGPSRAMPPRLIWVELEKNKEVLGLALRLKKTVQERGILSKLEERSFLPHITLGRIKTWEWRRLDPEERPEIEKELALSFKVKSVEVMESKLKRGGAEYTILESIYFNT